MSGKDFQEEAMLAAVKPLKAVNSTMSEGSPALRQLSAEDSNSLEGLFQRHHDPGLSHCTPRDRQRGGC